MAQKQQPKRKRSPNRSMDARIGTCSQRRASAAIIQFHQQRQHSMRQVVRQLVPAALAQEFLVDRWVLLRLGAGNNGTLTSMSDSPKMSPLAGQSGNRQHVPYET
jgi:hypothetical protein